MKVLLLFLIPFSVMGQSDLLLKDDFSSNLQNWPLGNREEIADGVLTLNGGEDGDEIFIRRYIDPLRDFDISAELSQTTGLTTGAYGITWGSDNGNYNVFLITSEGEFLTATGDLSNLKKWKKAPVINGLSQKNILKIESRNGLSSFYINNVKVGEQRSFPFYGNLLGFIMLSQMQLQVDNLIVDQVQKISLPEKVSNFAARENLGSGVNSAEDEIGPIISSDGSTLYFARQNIKENVGGIYDDEDIWYSTFDNKAWTTARNMGKGINTSLADNLVAVSADDNTMMFEKEGFLGFKNRTQNGGWTEFEKLDLLIRNESDYFVATLSPDGKAIIFSAKLKDNLHYDPNRVEGDLFVSVKNKNNQWSPPINLGSHVNTAGNETSPYLSADGKTLYFATDGRPGYGDHDIFFTRRTGEGWQDWSEPLNLGPTVNSTGFDAYYSVPASGDYAYFVSYSNDNGKADIFRIKLHEDIKPKPVIMVKGIVSDNTTKGPLGATIHFEDLTTGAEIGEARSDPKTGKYRIVLPYGVHYGLRAIAKGYYSVNENIELKQDTKYSEVIQNLYLVPIAVGETVKLNNIFFEAGLAELKPQSFPELDRLVKVLIDNPGIHIELAGHTDAKGTPEALLQLSQDRVDAVKNYLVKNNVSAERISGKGYGATMPVAPSDTEENSRLNRRVEFKITKQ